MVSDKATKCPKCGTDPSQPTEQEQDTPLIEEERKSNRTLYILIAVAFVALCAGLFFIFNGKGNSFDESYNDSFTVNADTLFVDSMAVDTATVDEEVIAFKRRKITDIDRMGLKGPIKQLQYCLSYDESESYGKTYNFDKNGMLTNTENEGLGVPENWSGEGISDVCVYKDGRIIESLATDVDGTTAIRHFEYVDSTQYLTIVYRVNAADNSREKALMLEYDDAGNLLTKDSQSPSADETVIDTDSYGNWTKIRGEGYKIIREFEYY